MNHTPEDVLRMVQAHVPNLKTQAQLNTFTAANDALRLLLDATFAQDAARILQARDSLEKALQLAVDVTDLGKKFEESPEAMGPAAASLMQPATSVAELDTFKQLSVELSAIGTLDNLAQWYTSNRARIDEIKMQGLRNDLLDAIREKKSKLTPA